jgi:two-component system response regulator RegX3
VREVFVDMLTWMRPRSVTADVSGSTGAPVPLGEPAGRAMVVDSDRHVRSHLCRLLQAHGYDVLEAPDGAEALALLDQEAVDLVLLELSLPGMSGFTLCRAIRARSDVGIVVVTSLQEEVDKVLALEIGADDYVTKPFLDRELALRAKAVLRRARRHRPTGEALRSTSPAHLMLDPQLQSVTLADRQVGLSPREFRLLELLARSGGRLVTREQILAALWGATDRRDSRTLDAQVRRLRDKIEDDPHRPTLLLTIRGRGYRLAL